MSGERGQYGTLEVAKMLGVSAMTVVRWIDRGLIPAHRTPGNHRRIQRDDLKHFIRRMDFPMPDEFLKDRWRVLAVDDEPEVLEVLTRSFRGREDSFEVHQAEDGVTAMIEVGRLRPDVLLLDIVLPGLDGIQVCQRIKNNKHLTTRIIAISGKATDQMREDILGAGADRLLSKPVSIHDIRGEVKRVLEE